MYIVYHNGIGIWAITGIWLESEQRFDYRIQFYQVIIAQSGLTFISHSEPRDCSMRVTNNSLKFQWGYAQQGYQIERDMLKSSILYQYLANADVAR